MKKIAILIIDIYQTFISILLKSLLGVSKTCRFEENCSSYSKRVILEEGVLRGVLLSVARVSRCHPLYKGNLYGNI